TKFALCLEPGRIEAITGAREIIEHAEEILPDEMRQHEAVMQRGAPAHARALLRLAPEPRNQRAHQQLLRKAHARMGCHLESTKFDQPEPSRRRIRREQLVD